MKEVRLTRREMLEISMLTNYQLEFYMKNKFRSAGMDVGQPISSWRDPETGDFIYSQEENA